MKRFAVNGTDKIEENEFGAFCLWAEAQKELGMLAQRSSPAEICHCPEHCLYHGRSVFERQKAALEEIIRNVELWRKADNMAGRICKIAEEGLGR